MWAIIPFLVFLVISLLPLLALACLRMAGQDLED